MRLGLSEASKPSAAGKSPKGARLRGYHRQTRSGRLWRLGIQRMKRGPVDEETGLLPEQQEDGKNGNEASRGSGAGMKQCCVAVRNGCITSQGYE
jgi:hypothetical protein